MTKVELGLLNQAMERTRGEPGYLRRASMAAGRSSLGRWADRDHGESTKETK